jgi:hypothetical protein
MFRRYKKYHDNAHKHFALSITDLNKPSRLDDIMPFGGRFHINLWTALYRGDFNTEEDLVDPKYYAYLIHKLMTSKAKAKHKTSYYKRLKEAILKVYNDDLEDKSLILLSLFRAFYNIENNIYNKRLESLIKVKGQLTNNKRKSPLMNKLFSNKKGSSTKVIYDHIWNYTRMGELGRSDQASDFAIDPNA